MFGLMEVFVLVGIIVYLIFWVRALVDVLQNEFQGQEKIIWLLVVILIPIIGPIVYWLIGRKKRLIN